MRHRILLLLFIFVHLYATAVAQPIRPELVVYAYDSFVAPEGLGPEIFSLFEKECGCRVRALASGDGGQLVGRLQLDAERGKSVAHVVLGLDQHLWTRAKPWLEPFEKWRPKGFDKISKRLLIIPPAEGFLPFDYGVFAFIADTQALKKNGEPKALPKSVKDLLLPQWKRNFILEDPRTSTPGLAFLLYTQAVLGSEVWNFWGALKGRWLTMAQGWDSAYGLFLKGEAPLVWSYTTSQAYHAEHGDHFGRYQAVLFNDGQPFQVEGAALVRRDWESKEARVLAQRFLEFLVSPEVQRRIPKKNWMLPVVKGVILPKSFKSIPEPKKLYAIMSDSSKVEAALGDWSRSLRVNK
jgi:thiamine transport system substrate-binding protein